MNPELKKLALHLAALAKTQKALSSAQRIYSGNTPRDWRSLRESEFHYTGHTQFRRMVEILHSTN